jgi:hypothetical protein
VGTVNAGDELPFEMFADGDIPPQAAKAIIPKMANSEIEMVRLFIFFSLYLAVSYASQPCLTLQGE